MTDIVKEAIADAKSLREGALENAKAILQEKFMPKIEEMIQESLINEEDDEELDLEESTDIDDDTSLDENEDIDIEETVEDDDEDLELESLLRELDEEDEELEESVDEDDDMDLELESLLRELDEDDDDMDLEESTDMDDDEDLELESLLRELDEEDSELETGEDEDDWEFDLDSDDKDCSCTCDCDELETENKKLKLENKSLIKSNSTVKRDLKEAYDAIKLMKDKINEVNLMNSKLLYTQKIFNAYELNEQAKMSILENFDNAASLKEVKLVYSTILAQYKQVSESKSPKTKLKGFASDTVIVEGKKPDTDTNSMVNRWQALAGLSTKD